MLNPVIGVERRLLIFCVLTNILYYAQNKPANYEVLISR